MGRVRKRRKLSTPEVLAAKMPVELNMLEFCGTPEGLRVEMRRVEAWLDEQVPGHGRELLSPVLDHVGFKQGDWFKRVLGYRPSSEPFHTKAMRQCNACGETKSGASAFSGPIYPDAPEKNICDECANG